VSVPAAIDAQSRESRLDRLESEAFDLLVIGGGITGAGIAREATLRGLSVALVDAADFAAGTSSRSSKLIHGGLRYLSQGDVALVRETALERKRVHALAPHLAEPSWMVVPARSRAGLLRFRSGLTTYEKLGAVEGDDVHRNWYAAELDEHEPLLNRESYTCACAYREYLTDDARLVLANLRAAVANGAEVVPHLGVDSLTLENGRIVGVGAICAHTGRKLDVRARVVINAAGPWVEAIRSLDETASPPLLHLSKGVHVVVRAERLPVRNLVILGTSDRRSIFAIPRGDCVYLGTTDTSYPGGAALWPRVELEDVQYLLEPLPRYFSVDPLGPEDCIGAWAGLRPLIAQPGKSAREISRKDEVWISDSGLVSIAGGKLTGYRKMAENVMRSVAEVLGQSLPEPSDQLAHEPLPGGDFEGEVAALAARLAKDHPADARDRPLDRQCFERLARLYGAESLEVLALGVEPLVPEGRVLSGEVDWAVGFESAETLEDLLYRRTRSALYEPEECARIAAPAANRMQALLGWTDAHREAEVSAVRARLEQDLAFLRGS
jgi:glycerol-3-phosphate dehydrogenase